MLNIKEAEINELHSELFKSQKQTREAVKSFQQFQEQSKQELEKVALSLTNIEQMEKDNGALCEKISQLQKQKEELIQQFEKQKQPLLEEIERLKKENEALKKANDNQEISSKA